MDYLQKMIVDLQRTILRSLPQTRIDRNARQNFSPKQPYIKRINTWQPNSRVRTDGFQKRNNNLTQNTFDHRGNRSNVRCYNYDKFTYNVIFGDETQNLDDYTKKTMKKKQKKKKKKCRK